jgi:Ni,Fe-hydrogenase III small subunit/Pyruvate/2-oxoacid:ferredoxin oxidoreductase delta subunit
MFKTMMVRIKQGFRTVPFPKGKVSLSERFRGLPQVDGSRCVADCGKCIEVCPTGAITQEDRDIRLDLGRCLFCEDCRRECPQGTIRFTQEHSLCAFKREDLVMRDNAILRAGTVDSKIKKLFGQSLKLRQVSAGGCNGCELDTNVLNTIVFDLGRFGIQFVASPRHADGLLVTGPVTQNMRLALQKTYDAVPSPKLVIAVGACAISGGPYIDRPEVHNGVTSLLPVDLFVPGCPPHPLTILDGLLRLTGKIG